MSSGDMEDMTASYSEICESSVEVGGSRPSQLELLNRLEGTVTKEGQMISFVADDLEAKLRLASPRGILAALESEACAVAASVDSLTESLSDTLHDISSLTVDCLEVYTGVVCKTCDAIDANIKAMYQLMAKCEELSKAMAPIYHLSGHVKNIKHLLDHIEASPT